MEEPRPKFHDIVEVASCVGGYYKLAKLIGVRWETVKHWVDGEGRPQKRYWKQLNELIDEYKC